MKVLCIGDAVVDGFLTVDENVLIQQGKKIQVDSCQFLLGGNACNVSIGLSRLGIPSSLCAEIGDDEFSQKIINGLTKEKVDLSLLKQTKGEMSSFAIGIQSKNDRTLFVYHVERKHHFDLTNASAEWVYLSSMGKEWKGAYEKVLSLQNGGIKLVFNPGTPQLSDGLDLIYEVLKKTDVLFVNKEEAAKISNFKFQISNEKEKNIKELLVSLQKMGVKIVVVTDGENGSSVIDENGKIYSFGVLSCKVVEKTGAGDAYTSGFLGALIYGKDIEEAMRWGAANAAAVVGKVGAQTGLLKREEISKARQ